MADERLKAWIAALVIEKKALLYRRTGNPIHAWSAYRTARLLGADLPGWVLACFDTWADTLTLQTHTSAKAIADALKIGTKGGPLVTAQAAREVRNLEIVADVLALKDRPTRRELKAMVKAHGLKGDVVDPGDRNITEILEQVAEARGLDYNSISKIYYKTIGQKPRPAVSHELR